MALYLPVLILALSLLFGVAKLRSYNLRRATLPPGPKSLWFIGNVHQLPKLNQYQTFGQWSRIYGPLVYFRVFGREFVVVNAWKEAKDLFEHRSAIYCTKPRLVMAGELTDKEQNHIVFAKYTPRLREWRKIVHSWMGRHSIEHEMAMQDLGVARLLEALLDDPEHFSDHFRTYSGGTLLSIIYGIRYASRKDPHLALSEYSAHLTSEAIRPGRWLCDSFPWLAYIPDWFPGAFFKRWARHAKYTSSRVIREPFERVITEIHTGVATPSWVADSLVDDHGLMKTGEDARNIMISAGSLYSAGTDTMVSALRTFLLMMILHPDIQRKAQDEVDGVVGNRLPVLADRKSLPFTGYIIKECLRICAVVPLMPHSLDRDDIYQGYMIPSGSWVVVNTWQILHDPSIYHEPESFRPDRYDPMSPMFTEKDPEDISFGIGRRSCLGVDYAKDWIFLTVSRMLSIFNVGAVLQQSGIRKTPAAIFEAGHIRYPSEFECELVPRSEAKERAARELVNALRKIDGMGG
ncbi:cytochrome P450 [Mycena olivaceomarginata]|nr:cytochrome P450 [Mycena olivaceomarginata]